MTLESALTTVKGIGPRRAADLERVGLCTVGDLLARFPLRYEDRATFRPVAALQPGERATIIGTITACGMRLTRRPGFKIFEATVGDASGSIRAVWLNQPFMASVMRRGARVILYGTADHRPPSGLQITNPQYELPGEVDHDSIHTGRTVPVYERAGSVTGRIQRTLVHEVLRHLPADLPDLLPAWIRDARALPDWRTSLVEAHFPPAGTELDQLNRFRSPAQVRLIFSECFEFQLGLALRRQQADAAHKACVTVLDDRVRAAVQAVLPFTLTGGQETALAEILGDMAQPRPMHRLLQGEVGSGKTIVALMAAVAAMENGFQVAFMAPTEILAEQHFLTMRRLLDGAARDITLVTGSTPAGDRRDRLARLRAGTIQLVVGTHALVQEDVAFARLGLVVIDEQHRFGVMQRSVLGRKGCHPDVLVMTATPIPRTLALTVYGDLDVSVIRDLPPGRVPIQTAARPQAAREEVYAFVRDQLDAGRQVYIVYPLVEESEKIDLRAATSMADHLAQDVFPQYRLALLHGRLGGDQKDRIMRAFAGGDVHLLVSTTVVEVGVDVPNASVMVVEHAERFGLSQLHQLRGRVGRGGHPSFCVLLYQEPLSEQGEARLRALSETADGFLIAERDLELRGPGDFFGTRQAGAPTLRSGDLLRDHVIMEEARRDAALAVDREPAMSLVLEAVRRTWADRFGLASVG